MYLKLIKQCCLFFYMLQINIRPETVASVTNNLENIISDAAEEDQTRENIETVANMIEMSSSIGVNEEVCFHTITVGCTT